ncbi:hypothetical protein C4544_03695 [candidate division WS5 bacterium]|uniref:NYN domain-containing protein n=1 Tax=candidate division WS5 bacterium TaxID=2093353 RepID=A0A419DDC3_9BACT|nr:MAG: hypothetical protein C4544_03695 [candidate division WS5 bacterium]
MKKVAIFVDWENIRKCIFEQAFAIHNNKVSYNDTSNVIKFINSFLNSDEEIYRIFFYLADPYSGIYNGVNYSKSKSYQHATAFIEKLSIEDLIAVRKGYLATRGIDSKGNPIFIQKQNTTDIHRELKEHADFIRPINFNSIFSITTS